MTKIVSKANATERLVVAMMRSKAIADYVEFGWNALYNDIIQCKGNWANLEPISQMALEDVCEHFDAGLTIVVRG